MSSPLAIGAVSAVLRNLLDDGLVDVAAGVGSVKVTAVAPDTVKLDDPDAGPSLNLFLYRVSANQGWRNAALPAFDANGARLTNPPLALDLHFLLTAYGSSDYHAEILLGYAMAILHERPVLERAAIRKALNPGSLGSSILPPAFQALAASDLADQVEAVTVTFEPMDTEEMSRLWSAIQAHYRPTAAYLVSVVLIQGEKPTREAPPVLSRGAIDAATGREAGVFVLPNLLPPLPTLVRVAPPNGQPAARLGETVRLEGVHLDGDSVEVSFTHQLLDTPRTIDLPANADPDGFDVALPTGSIANLMWPAGVWTVAVNLVRPGETVARTTNVAAMVLAPEPVLTAAPAVSRDAVTGAVTVTLEVRPLVRPRQRATLALGSDVATAEAHAAATGTLTFLFGVVPDGSQWVRLTVDGAESLLVDRSTTPPSYFVSQTLLVPV